VSQHSRFLYLNPKILKTVRNNKKMQGGLPTLQHTPSASAHTSHRLLASLQACPCPAARAIVGVVPATPFIMVIFRAI
jgi:hypothetical protein